MRRVVLVARQHIHPQHQPQAGEDVGVVAVRRPARLVWVVTNDCAFLVPIERLRRGVDVEHPGLAQQRRRAIVQMALQPAQAGGLVDLRQVAAQRVLADQLVQAKQRRVHCVTAERGDVRVAAMAGQGRQQQRSEQVALARGIRAAQPQRAVGHPGVKQATLLQVVDEKRQLPERCDRGGGVPFHTHPTAERVRDSDPLLNRHLFTRGVTGHFDRVCVHSSQIRRFGQAAQSPNCRIQVHRGFRQSLAPPGRGVPPTIG